MEQNIRRISGMKCDAADRVWELLCGNLMPDEFMGDYTDINGAVREFMDSYEGDLPTFWWAEMNAEYSADEMLVRYLECWQEQQWEG